eukprot:CAMPEP_0178421852 /NCGR_PEP_ID=MMETSP0689_2-20121128/26865_1 /TAXON_ID=160604 /ORGANISM="Amphidinium massartii, Strain CS-259" /LENGTH=143 /DNA_ID=CAMNT_0020043385 /DNA_START=867 /DNA_END=1295 /DNA_ORIENTATION=-
MRFTGAESGPLSPETKTLRAVTTCGLPSSQGQSSSGGGAKSNNRGSNVPLDAGGPAARAAGAKRCEEGFAAVASCGLAVDPPGAWKKVGAARGRVTRGARAGPPPVVSSIWLMSWELGILLGGLRGCGLADGDGAPSSIPMPR